MLTPVSFSFLIVFLNCLPNIHAKGYRDVKILSDDHDDKSTLLDSQSKSLNFKPSRQFGKSNDRHIERNSGGRRYVDYDTNSDDYKLLSESSFPRRQELVDDQSGPEQNSSPPHFGYKNTDEWSKNYPECGGTQQSPIDLNSNSMTRFNVSRFTWKNYPNTPRNMTIINNGHTVELAGFWNAGEAPTVSGGTLVGEYEFAQLHFHWGEKDGTGSEHTVNGHSLPLEMHMVHYKKAYGSVDEAKKQDDGLAVVGILFDIGKFSNRGIQNLQKYANSVKSPNSQIVIDPFPLSNFNMSFPPEYVSYLGSLTTPPCSEIVTWILPAFSRSFTRAQLNFFRRIELADGDKSNYRPTMPLNDRMVYYISHNN